MVTWKVVLVVIVVAVLAMAVGMWLGYQYVSEKEDISPGAGHVPSDLTVPGHDQPLAFSPVLASVLIG